MRNEEVKSFGKYLKEFYNLIEIGKGFFIDVEIYLKEIIKICMKGRLGFYEIKMVVDYKKVLFLCG